MEEGEGEEVEVEGGGGGERVAGGFEGNNASFIGRQTHHTCR